MRRLRWWSLVAAGVGVSLCAERAPAQDPAGQALTLRGTIVAAGTATPLPYTIVELVTAFSQRFTDQAGAFSFSGLAPGTYRLRARQIGYRPVDTTLTVRAGDGHVTITMLRLAIRLSAMTITGQTSCERPGAPDPALNPELSAVFEQVLENARRFQLLADAYQYRSSTLRTFTTVDREKHERLGAVDTLLRESWNRWEYRPGQVIGSAGLNNDVDVRLPTLGDFADSAFVNAHCFWLAGRDTLAGQRFIRVDFAPTLAINTPDIQGAAYLDSLTYQMRYVTVQLTRPEKVNRDIGSVEATTRFLEVMPGIPALQSVRSVQSYLPRALRRDRALPVSRIEQQELLAVHFVRAWTPEP